MRAMRSASATDGETAAVFVAGREALRNGDVHYEFRQRSTFYYLTGFEEPDAVAVLRPGADDAYVLFVRPHDPERALWDGPREGVQGAVERFDAAAYPIDELETKLPELLAAARTVYFSLGSDERVEEIVSAAVGRRRDAPNAVAQIVDPHPLVAKMRLIKSADEVRLLQRAIDVTGAGLDAAMRATRPGMREYEVQAVLEAEYRRLGSMHNAFPSIVAAGANACTLHYVANRARIEDRDLLLVDTGAEHEYYCADITRTFPANGRFTPAQRAVYDVVLEAQADAIATVAPGVPIVAVHEAALKVVARGLRRLGVLSGRTDAIMRRREYAPYFMHGTSHWLGIDVHDVGAYRDGERPVALRPGMVLTVEPGIYIGPRAKAPRRLRGIGVRIEDDVLVTRGGHRVLSAAIPSDPEALEALVGSAT